MKKIILIALVAFSIASCRKERTCECTQTTTSVYKNAQGNTVTNVNVTSEKVTRDKQKAKEFRMLTDCYSSTATTVDSDGDQTTVDWDCKIK